MISIKQWFLPGRHNNYHPSALRTTGLILMIVALLFINLSYNLVTAKQPQVLGYATSISPSQIISLTNQNRANSGLGGLSTNSQLTQAAQAKAQDMFAKNYWGHYSPDGTGPWYFITSAGYDYATAGENLAKDFNTSEGVVNGWMNSPGHRDNILNTSYRDIGVAAVNGTLQGSQTTIVVAMYGSLKSAPAPAPAPSPPPAAPSYSAPSGGSTAPTTAPASTDPTSAPEPAPSNQTSPEESNNSTLASVVPNSTIAAASEAEATQKAASERALDIKSVSVREDRNWAQNASLFIVSALFLVNVMKHTVVWRTQRRGWRHIWLRAHPLAQYSLLLVAICANLVSSVGVIR